MKSSSTAVESIVVALVVMALSACNQEQSKDSLPSARASVSQQALSDGGTLVLTVTPGTTAYVGGGVAPAVAIDPALSITGDQTVTGAVVGIGTGFVSGQDVLGYTTLGTITGAYDSTRGTLTLSGAGTLAQYEAALRSVKFSSSSTPTTGNRTISFSLGTAVSNPDNGHFYEFVTYNSTWNQAQANVATRTYLGMQGYLVTVTTLAENNFIRTKLTSDGWIGALASSNSFPRTWSWAGGPEQGVQFCTNNSAGVWAVSNSLYANWAGGEPNNAGGEGCGQIYFASSGTWNDLPCNSSTQQGYVAEYGGTPGDGSYSISGTRTVSVSYTAVGLTPTATTLTYVADAGAVVADPGITVAGTGAYNTATVSVQAGYVSGQDSLDYPPNSAIADGGISSSFNASSGVLTLTGPASPGDYQSAFRTVTYTNSVSPLPTTAIRNLRFTLNSVLANRALQVQSYPTVTVTSSNGNAAYQSSVTFTATLTPSGSTGSVEFFADGTSLGTRTLTSGAATLSTSALSIGTHAITVNYAGDTQRQPGVGSFNQTITTMPAGAGPCTAGDQATVCTSGLCNTTTSTCGQPNNGACTAANQCVSNICALNNLCGNPNAGACTSGAQCQSGACSPNANTCIPQGGCAVTADCGPGYQCNASLQCEVAPGLATSDGGTIYNALTTDAVVDPQVVVVGTNNVVGATVTLGTGFVGAQDSLTYPAPVAGITGSYDAAKGVLTLAGTASSADYQAALRTVGYHNSAGATPSTAVRVVTFGLGSAVANGDNGHFYEFVASSGTWNAAKVSAAARSYLGLHGYLATITSANENAFIFGKLTSDGWIGAQANPETSFPRTWYWAVGPEAGTAFCSNPNSGNCSSISGAYSNWAGGEPNNAGGEGCGQIYFGQQGRWNDLRCNGTTLAGYVVEYGGSATDPVIQLSATKMLQVRAATSLGLTSSAQSVALHDALIFTATLSPSTATGAIQFFVDGLAVGAPVSVDASGVATFSTSDVGLGAHAVTATYAGDTQDQAADGSVNGQVTVLPLQNGAGPCNGLDAVTDCVSGVCSASGASAGTCGYGTNEGPCTAGPDALCQSGVCSVGQACMPSTPGACYVDADCTSGAYCDRASNTCVTQLVPGSPLPSDGLHDGTCPVNGASVVCTTGTCNVTTNTCGSGTGSDCTAANQCNSNTCSASGKCVPAPGTGDTSCWADGDCAGSTYCNHNAYLCAAKLAAGEPIPTDGLHDGVCTVTTVAPACASGLCNAASNTCADATNSACSSNAQCQYGTCSHGKCGLSDGEAGCTTSSTALCQSGACSASGTCIPNVVGGCFIDSDCTGAQYCERSSYTCATKGAPGTALPNDGALHTGVCSDALATAACTIALCNPVTNTCASSNGSTCTGASECTTDICGSNGQCGQANGDGPCTVVGGAISCQSGHCNASADSSTSACVPTATGCWVDSDCAGSQYCARSTFTCTTKAGPGATLPSDGLHPACPSSGVSAACASGVCNPVTNTCGSGNSTGCTAANQCVSNACGSNGVCGLADGQAGCTSSTGASVCQSGACTASGVCAPGGGCFIDSDCSAGQYCERATLSCKGQLLSGASLPNDGLHDGTCDATSVAACATGACNAATKTCAANKGADCATASQCVGNACGSNGKCGLADGQPGCTVSDASACQSSACSKDGVCIPQGTASCWADVDCTAAEHCKRDALACVADDASGTGIANDTLHDGICSAAAAQTVCASGQCNPAKNTCADLTGASCTSAAQCVVDVCGSNHQCGFANGQPGCTTDTAARCQSGACSSAGTCIPSKGCWVDADCSGGQYCDRSSTTCRSPVGSGAAIPNDGLHDGSCTEANAKVLCASGLCNATTNTCAMANSDGCTVASQCQSNVCSADGKCGQVDGSACTSDAVCRTGCVHNACAKSDVGVLTGGGGCSSTGGSNGLGVLAMVAVALLVSLRRSRLAAGLAGVIAVTVAPSAQAQTSASPGAAIDTFRTASPGSDWFSTDSLDLRGTVRPSARLLIDWAHDPLVVTNPDGTKRSTAVQNQLWFNLGGALTLFDRVRVSINIPVAAYQNGFGSNFGGVGVNPSVAGGFGDLGFGADVRLFGEYGQPFSLAAGLVLTAPTGSSQHMLGDGRTSAMPRVMAAGQSGLFVWAAQAGFNIRGGSIAAVDFGNEVRFAISGGVKVLGDKLVIGPEFFAVAPVGAAAAYRPVGLEGDLGAHYAITPDWRVGGGLGTGLARSAGVPDVRLLAAVDWSPAFEAPKPPDADGDGVPDSADACPNVKGDASADEKASGCPAPLDDDHDGVANAADACPAQASGPTPDPKRPGCPAPLDSDGDGVPDDADACPTAAGVATNAQQPGCPETDSDGDGVSDSADQCPSQAPGNFPDPQRKGCALPDADGDGVPDALDACPGVSGAPSDVAAKSGCPGLVTVEGDRLRINAPVRFAVDKEVLLSASLEVLDAVASTMKAMPQIERLAIEGHSDAHGSAAANQALSERRANSVMAWLVEHGISASRLEAHGYGQSRPVVVDEKTDDDRQLNRRVEFNIVKSTR